MAQYFTSRERVCLFAAMTLGEEQDTFADAVRTYFTDWGDALAGALRTRPTGPAPTSPSYRPGRSPA